MFQTTNQTISVVKTSKASVFVHLYYPYAPWCWNIYLQNWVIDGINVGKYAIDGAYGLVVNYPITVLQTLESTMGELPTLIFRHWSSKLQSNESRV